MTTGGMSFDIASVNASLESGKLAISFEIEPEFGSHLDLETGEMLQHSRYGKLYKKEEKTIAARLFMGPEGPSAAGTPLRSEMSYHRGREEPLGEIDFVWRASGEELTALHSLIIAGYLPQRVYISLEDDALGYGWEPDGSGQRWANTKTPRVPITSVSFRWTLKEDAASASEFDATDVASYTDPKRIAFELITRLAAVEKRLAQIGWSVAAIAVLFVLYFLLRGPWRG